SSTICARSLAGSSRNGTGRGDSDSAVWPLALPTKAAKARRQAATSLPCFDVFTTSFRGASVRPAPEQRDAAGQVGRAQQLVVGHRVLGRLVRIARLARRLAGAGLVVLLVTWLVARLGGLRLGVGRLVGGLGGKRRLVGVGDRAPQVLLAEAGAR